MDQNHPPSNNKHSVEGHIEQGELGVSTARQVQQDMEGIKAQDDRNGDRGSP